MKATFKVQSGTKKREVKINNFYVFENKKNYGFIAVDGNIYKNRKEVSPYYLFGIKKDSNLKISAVNQEKGIVNNIEIKNSNIYLNNEITHIQIFKKGFYIGKQKVPFSEVASYFLN